MLNHICFEVKPYFIMGVATMAFHLQILTCLPQTNSIRLESKFNGFIAEFEVSDHQRMDILTNLGFMTMFYFAGWLKPSWSLKKKRIVFTTWTVDYCVMRQDDCAVEQHVGSQSRAVHGFFCQPLSFYNEFQKVFFGDWITFLRSRGSTHRSHWRPGGQT